MRTESGFRENIAKGNHIASRNKNIQTEAEVLQERRQWRVWFILVCFGILTSLVLARLLTYQLFQHNALASPALASSSPAIRGTIVDRDGELLAADRIHYQLSATPILIKTDAERMIVAQQLEKLIGIPAYELHAQLTESVEKQFVILAKTIPYTAGQHLLEWKAADEEADNILQHIHLTVNPHRFYPQDTLASQLIGFVGADTNRTSHYGLEEYYNRFLREDGVGLTGTRPEQIDILGPNLRRFIPSSAGKDLILTLDRTIQWIIEDELYQNIDFYRAHGGTIIVMEPQTGAILGLANWPNYNPNHYGKTDFALFSNPAISAQYEPGSIFKVITMAAALDTEVIEPTTLFNDTGSIAIGGRIFLNSTRSASGIVTASRALALSLNVVTAEIASQVGSEKFYQYIRRFGFGEATEVDLANEIPGLLKAPGMLDWSESDLATNSFGQGLAVTPIQMINAVAAIANQGKLMRPYIVQRQVQNESVKLMKPTVVRGVISAKASADLTRMMVDVIETGNREARVHGYSIAGKSGTAQIPTETGYNEDETIVSFIGFAPADDPQFVVLVKLDRPDPDISPWAAYTAAPTFSRVARRIFKHMNIPPDEIRLAAK